MSVDISEKNFESIIEATLLEGTPDAPTPAMLSERKGSSPYLVGGYRKRKPEDYDKTLCLDTETVLNFIYATQPKEWDKLQAQYGEDAKGKFSQRLKSEIDSRGTLDVLRKGIKANGSKFKLAYFQPSSALNPELGTLYRANLFTVTRQLKYSERNENSLDVVLFLNGLPIFTAELKNPLMGQTVQNAIKQYQTTRDSRELLFAFGRCLSHFAVDPDLVYFTTHLQGSKTRFFPFNRGRNGGAGNSPSWNGFATSYLWEEVWARDSVLNLIERFIQIVDVEDEDGNRTGERRLLFPRYHQLDAVRRLITHARGSGAGQRYLIQHSAGSGKSNSISWLAHQLSVLHDDQNNRVFDSIIVISDRRVIDRQLQSAVRQFEQTLGVVETIDTTSKQLKQALEEGKTIIVTTLQKFPVIVNQIGELRGNKFAVIIDEAHSSQSGESTKGLKAVLATNDLSEAEKEDDVQDTLEDEIAEEMRKRGRLTNVSFFAFTATPKDKTLELFGTHRPDGKYEPFSLYTMRQAIEEGFILDVLENYTTYKAYWSLLKTIQDDPRYDRNKATRLIRNFVDLHEHTIDKKVAAMVEHFSGQVMHRIGGKAKAMIVTRSRLHAVRFRHAVDDYLKKNKLPFKALVAFSGTVKDGGIEYTEANMNGLPEKQTALTFRGNDYRILIVANKFQTGFDQPLLHTMYVDKRLQGVNAVQTLSRLNRIHPEKHETMVMDFANEADDIQKGFAPYYDRLLLKGATDPNQLYDLETRMSEFNLFEEADVQRFAEFYFNPKTTQDKLHAALDPIVEKYKALPEDERTTFRGYVAEYVRLYSFLSQVVSFVDSGLEKLFVFCRLLIRKLPVTRERLPVEIQRSIDIDSYRLQETHKGKIELERGATEVDAVTAKQPAPPSPEEIEALSQIIREINQRFSTDFDEEDRTFIEQLESRLTDDAALNASLQANTPENARLTFDFVVNDRLQEMIDSNFKFYKQIADDKEFAAFFLDWLFERYRKGKGSE